MRSTSIALVCIVLPFLFLTACNNETKQTAETKPLKLKEEAITYKVDSLNMNSFLVYDENKERKRPAVLVVHEWWGLNDYVKSRAKQLAELGYVALAVDMYGNGQMGTDVQTANALAMPFYQNPQMAKSHFDAALNKLKENPNVDTSRIAAIGYCFGGAIVLGVAKMGDDLKGVVSFHGNLFGAPPDKNLLKAEILVCHGGADSFVKQPEVDQFKKEMDSIGAKYTLKVYDGATHAFTNPQATEWGQKFKLPLAYNAAADTASWNEMKNFFDRIFK
ncbi:MAG: dienelactone hydrolase family protein [Bacteroidetes bacterium]|nr:MAG: dienelactone hydrolase family protein [Bacteroidota bacterium]